ncbi:MAG TPA: NAD-dependent epimerase/dehydratase family protein [Mycobacterium sp.]|nr:NAD-dependent epimerase/dehydratase family protein [Mycobacterium sp.]
MTETVLVTGGTGFIARWCIAELLQRGYRVRTTVRSPFREAAVRDAVSRVVDPGDRLTCVVADLTSDDGWDDAVSGCDYVLHVASPLGLDGSGDLVAPARDGALRVLRAATAAGVKRVVLTSAANTASPSSYRDDGISDETLWTDPEAPGLQAYRKSKTLAERAAWEFMEKADGPTTLTTVLPGAVFGPILDTENLGSVQVIGRMLRGRMPGTPRIGLEVVDVRDIADVHIRAMASPAAAGQRFLATGEFMWMGDIAAVLRDRLGPDGAKVPTRAIPDMIVRLVALFDPEMRSITPGLGRKNRHTTAKAHELLGWRPRPAADTVVDCARSLIENGAA